MDIAVRLAHRDAAPELTALHRRAAHTGFAHIFPPDAPPPTYEEDLARWEHWLGPDRAQGRRAYVAVASGRIVGVVLAGPDPDEPGVGHLARLYVDPVYWGRRIGTQLHATALRDLTGRGFREATLWVLEANSRARTWYERLGWRASGMRKPTYEPAGIFDVQYRLALLTTLLP
ncbi:MAG TPA: GNAT family N-acetyltransferase [Acidimicrobiales bacterium]